MTSSDTLIQSLFPEKKTTSPSLAKKLVLESVSSKFRVSEVFILLVGIFIDCVPLDTVESVNAEAERNSKCINKPSCVSE